MVHHVYICIQHHIGNKHIFFVYLFIYTHSGSTIKYIPASTRKSRKKALSREGIAGVTIAAFVFGVCLVISLLAYLEQRRRVSHFTALFLYCDMCVLVVAGNAL